jgi:hypothetical protein
MDIIIIFDVVWLYLTMFFIKCIFYDATTTDDKPETHKNNLNLSCV